MRLPNLDMTDWSILDFELCLDGLRHVSDATSWLQNQPRSGGDGGDYHPGADFIVRLGEDWCGAQIDAVVQRLRQTRFPDPGDDERRLLLLISYDASHGPSSEPLAAIIAMALEQSVRP